MNSVFGEYSSNKYPFGGLLPQKKGTDEGGNYITYEDIWDINPVKGKSSSDSTPVWQKVIEAGRTIGLDRTGDIVPFGKPFEIHGKQYYDKDGKPVKHNAEGGFLKPKTAWDSLSMKEKAEMMKVAVENGITNLKEIWQKYNEFAEGGDLSQTDWSYDGWKKQIAAHKNINVDRDNSYDYESFFRENPQMAWKILRDEPDAHFPDTYKTVYHPTFSTQSRYSGQYHPQYNPYALEGGIWNREGTIFTMSPDGYRGPVSMDDRKWYLENAEDYGVQLREANGSLPIYDGIPWGGVLPAVTVTGRKKSLGGELRGPLVEAMKDASNEFAWGGELGNYNDGWGDLTNFLRRAYHKVKRTFSGETKQQNSNQATSSDVTYRNRPAEIVVTNPFDKQGSPAPIRIRQNTSKTQQESEELEDMMRKSIVNDDVAKGLSNPEYDIPFIPEKAILIDGSTTSTNVLDSLAKYAGIHNRNPRLSQHHSNLTSSTRQINMNEMLGLSTQETHNGAMPKYNFANSNEDKHKALNVDYKTYNRALGNANYFTAFGYIPAENLVRNFQYNDTQVDRSTPPLLDAFRYYAQGDYNRGDKNHTKNVNDKGKKAWENPKVKEWWELSGKYWYNLERGHK